MKFLASLVFFVTLMAALTGCTSFTKQPFDRSANPSIKKIAILPVKEPQEMRVINLGGVGSAFGILGAAITLAEQERKSDEFTRKVTGQQTFVGKHLTQTIEAELTKQGYVVTVLSNRYGVIDPELPADEDADYSRITTDADAILHVWFGLVGYLSPPLSTDYNPHVLAAARLIDAKAKSELYFQSFAYQKPDATEEDIHYITPSGYAYGDFDSLMASSIEAAQGLKYGVGAIGARIANDLSKSDQPAVSAPAIAAAE